MGSAVRLAISLIAVVGLIMLASPGRADEQLAFRMCSMEHVAQELERADRPMSDLRRYEVLSNLTGYVYERHCRLSDPKTVATVYGLIASDKPYVRFWGAGIARSVVNKRASIARLRSAQRRYGRDRGAINAYDAMTATIKALGQR